MSNRIDGLDEFQFTFVSGVPCTTQTITGAKTMTAPFQFTFVSGVPCTEVLGDYQAPQWDGFNSPS